MKVLETIRESSEKNLKLLYRLRKICYVCKEWSGEETTGEYEDEDGNYYCYEHWDKYTH